MMSLSRPLGDPLIELVASRLRVWGSRSGFGYSAMLKPPAPPSQNDALIEMFGSSRWDFVPIRKTFVQLRDSEDSPLAAPLASVVGRGVPSALDQLLLLHARAAGRPDGDELNYDVGVNGGCAMDLQRPRRPEDRRGRLDGVVRRRSLGGAGAGRRTACLLYTSPSPRDRS